MKALQRRKSHTEHVDTEGSWAISYGDMVTLLLSFFVLYFTVDHSKVRENKMQDALMMRLQESGIEANKKEALNQQLNIGPTPGQGVDPLVLKKFGAQVMKDEHRLVIDFKDISFFDVGNTDVTTVGNEALLNFSKAFLPFSGQYSLQVQAYTDTRKVKASSLRYRDNLELSALRAVAAVRSLQKSGIPLRRMKIAGYGELTETQEKLMKFQNETDPLKYSRKVVLVIEPEKEGN